MLLQLIFKTTQCLTPIAGAMTGVHCTGNPGRWLGLAEPWRCGQHWTAET